MIFTATPLASAARNADDAYWDTLAPEQVQRLKYEAWSTPQVAASVVTASAAKPRIVAEGDSWFDYMPGVDILDHLMRMGYDIQKVADGGDTVENMVFGTAYKRNFSRQATPLDQTIQLLQQHESRVLLFSGGGNDIAGAELEAFLNHRGLAERGYGALRTQHVHFMLGEVMRDTYRYLIERVRREVGADTHIISHGYGWAIPDGRAVVNLPFIGWRFVGPWLRPALTKKNYVDAAQARAIMRELIDVFNDTLRQLAQTPEYEGHFHYIDLRHLIADDWWVNELHLSNSGFRKVAEEFDRVIKEGIGMATV